MFCRLLPAQPLFAVGTLAREGAVDSAGGLRREHKESRSRKMEGVMLNSVDFVFVEIVRGIEESRRVHAR